MIHEIPQIEALPKLYALTLQDFLPRDSIDPQSYEHMETVTRSNFVNFYLGSFRAADGDRLAQEMYFQWIKVNNGFNYSLSFGNFQMMGGLFCLSHQEQRYFMEEFRKLKQHDIRKSATNRDLSRAEIALAVEEELRVLLDYRGNTSTLHLGDEWMQKLEKKNFEGFLKIRDDYLLSKY